MKKITALTAIAALTLSLMSFSGCNDFKFNPIGEWKLTDDIVYEHDKEIDHATEKDMPFVLTYTFGKSGTGYISTGGEKTQDFQYEYDDNTVTLTMDTIFAVGTTEDEKTKNPITVIQYQVSDDKTQMSFSQERNYYTEEGSGTLSEKRVLTKQ